MLSKRGEQWSAIDYAHGEKYSYDPSTNPDGTVDFGNAENRLIQDALADFFNKDNRFHKDYLSYGEGYTGTLRLRAAMAKHLNAFFSPVTAIDAEEITFAAGVTALNEACALVTCDEGEAIMLGRPVYGAFYGDFTTRTKINLEYVDVGDTDQFGPSCVTGFRKGLEAARERGVTIKALVICNPNNPLGACYPRETLVELMRFCNANTVHLISDEIYALSTYPRDDRPSEKFTSVRSIDMNGLIDPSLVHVLYGMSKDFGAAGLRLGCIISQNKQFTDAIRAVCRFSSPSSVSMELVSRLLEDQDFVKGFLQRSQQKLRDARLLAERLLEENEIPYHKPGNAGLFIWVNLSSFLPLSEVAGDGWKAERLLNRRLRQEGVVMSYGEAYHAEKPGHFRLVFSIGEHILRKGVKRITNVIKSPS